VYRFKRMEVCWRSKWIVGALDLLDTVQTKEALCLSQVTVANCVPDALMRNYSSLKQ